MLCFIISVLLILLYSSNGFLMPRAVEQCDCLTSDLPLRANSMDLMAVVLLVPVVTLNEATRSCVSVLSTRICDRRTRQALVHQHTWPHTHTATSDLSLGVPGVDVFAAPVERRHHVQIRVVVDGQHHVFGVGQREQDGRRLHGTHQHLVPETQRHTLTHRKCKTRDRKRGHSHVSGVVL